MISENFAYLAFALIMIGDLSYLRAVLKGTVKPNRVTWGLWAVGPMLGFFGQLDEGVGLTSLLTLAVALGPLAIFIGSLTVKNAYWELGKLDYMFGALAVTGLILWQITGEGTTAIIFSITAEILAAIPTIIKSYKQPDTESPLPYGFCVIASVVTMLTIDDWRFEEYSYSVYLTVACLFLFVLVQFRLGDKVRARKS